MSFAFIQGPQGRAMTDADFLTSSLDQPLSLGSTFWENTKQGVNESFGLGTAIRNLSTPEAAPPSDGGIGDMIGAVNRAIAPDSIIRRVIGTEYDGQSTLSEDQYKASPSYRESIPFAPGMTEDRAASLAQADDLKKVREFYASKRPVTAFFGKLAGSAIDPINYIPIAGEAVAAANAARFGRVGGAALTSSLDAAANTALFGLATAPVRGQLGDDVGFQETITQVAMAALIGGAFGAVGGALGRGRGSSPELRAEAETKLATLQRVQESRVALNDAIDGMLNHGEVKLSSAGAGFSENLTREIESLSKAYDAVHADIQTGAAGSRFDHLVEITPEDIEGAFISRGGYKGQGDIEVKGGGFGLVKFILRHGEKSGKSPELQITKQDVLDFPSVIREYSPVAEARTDGTQRTWVVEKPDGRRVVYGDSWVTGQSDQRGIVTIHVDETGRALSEKKMGQSSEATFAGRPGNTAPTASLRPSESGPNGNIGQTSRVDNSSPRVGPDPRVTEAATRVGKPEADRAMAEQYRVNPETGEYPELADIERLRAEGKLTAEDIAALDDADAILTTANSYGEALKAFAVCEI